MNRILLKRVARSDAADLIAANRASRSHHLPWVDSFIDQAGFDQWFARCLTGPNVGFIARERTSGAVVGVVNLNEIVGGCFRALILRTTEWRSSAARG
ncbi:hypothetical protein SY91_04288 [Burkholderia cenocepacia]|nr:hypothetical protein SY91_04288 [Burkholderia cenocepacia]